MWIVSQKTWETRVAAEERDCHGALDAGQSSARAGVETAPLPDLPGIHSIHRVPWAVCAGQTWGGGSPFSSKRESSRVILDHDPGQLLSSGSAALLSLRHTQRRQWDGIRCRSGLRGERLQLWHCLTRAVNFWYNMGTCLLPRGIGLGSWGLLMDTKLIYTLRLVSLRRRRRGEGEERNWKWLVSWLPSYSAGWRIIFSCSGFSLGLRPTHILGMSCFWMEF